MNEINVEGGSDWSPNSNDPAFLAGYNFVERNIDRGDEYQGGAPLWYGWMVRQGFWEGVRFARAEQQSEALKDTNPEIDEK